MGYFKKRGAERSVYAAIGMTIGVILFVLFINEGAAIAKQLSSNEFYLANDIALTINALQALSGDVIYDYPESVSNFKIEIINGIVKVKEMDKSFEAKKTYVPMMSSSIVKTFVKPNTLSFSKIGNTVDVTQYKQYFGKEVCPTITTEGNVKDKIIYIDPGHYENEKGLIGKYEEYKLTKKIADKIKALCSNCRIIEQKSLEEKQKFIFNPDLVISLQIGNSNELVAFSQEKTNPFAMQSEKLACLVTNKFSKIISVTRTQSENFPDEYTKTILKNDAPSVIVQIGNINNKEMFNDEADLRQMAQAIYESIKEYYKPSLGQLPSETEVLVKNGAAAYN